MHIGASRFLNINKQLQIDSSFEADAEAMAAIARSQQFEVKAFLVGDVATREAVMKAIQQFARGKNDELQAGEMLLLTFSGHGFQRQTEPEPGLDVIENQTWVLRDREIFDFELGAWLQGFKPGVRIVVVSDSCNSGSIIEGPALFMKVSAFFHTLLGFRERVLRAAPAARERAIAAQNARRTEALQTLRDDGWLPVAAEASTTAAAPLQPNPRPFVLLLSACQDGQSARADDNGRGLFTNVVEEAWGAGAFKGDNAAFHQKVSTQVDKRSKSAQTPSLLPTTPTADNPLPSHRPFTIALPTEQPLSAGT